MKARYYYFLFLSLCYFGIQAQPNVGDESTESPGYFLVWSDEFDGAALNTTDNWFHQTQLPAGGSWFNNELQHYTNRSENSSVVGGILSITGKRESAPFVDQSVAKDFTSARLNSKFAFTYGRVDVRAKLPASLGTWPAIWMLGQAINEDGGYWDGGPGETTGSINWPLVGEIDIMEQKGTSAAEKEKILGTVHTNANSGGASIGASTPLLTGSSLFHTYSIVWNED